MVLVAGGCSGLYELSKEFSIVRNIISRFLGEIHIIPLEPAGDSLKEHKEWKLLIDVVPHMVWQTAQEQKDIYDLAKLSQSLSSTRVIFSIQTQMASVLLSNSWQVTK